MYGQAGNRDERFLDGLMADVIKKRMKKMEINSKT